MTENQQRGREADSPRELPRSGWKDVLLRTREQIGKDHVTLLAAGSAFFCLLALFPAIAAVVAIWGLIAEPGQVVDQIDGFTATLPDQAAEIVHNQATSAADAGSGTIVTATIGILLGIWSASKGVNAIIEGLNVAYDEEDGRSFLRKTLLRLALTVAAIVGVLCAAALVVVLPAVLKAVGLGAGTEFLIGAAKWVLLFVGAVAAFAVLYRYAPDRDRPRWTWLSPGAVLGVVVWIAGSALFSVYVSNFANYNETYGALGGVVILMMWLFLTSFVILMGAELNAELERQTRRDTTQGAPRPMGKRGALAADTLGETKPAE